MQISTHTLRGERDRSKIIRRYIGKQFQLTRSVGSVTADEPEETAETVDFNSHAPWGA